MGFRYQKRVRLARGTGLNLSSGGISTSYRNKYGSIGSRGFSIRTGIPGLSFRSSWGKSKEGLVILLVFGAVYLGLIIIYNAALFLIFVIKFIYAKISNQRPVEKD